MADITKPIALDESFNTTETTPRNIADVVADETGDLVTQAQAIVTKLQGIINAVKPNASDIPLDPITGMSADDVQEGISELKGTLDVLGNIRFQSAFNANSIDIDFGFVPSTSKGGQILLFNSNQSTVALFKFDTTPSAAVVFGSKTYTVGINGSILTITPNSTLWGITTLLIDDRQ